MTRWAAVQHSAESRVTQRAGNTGKVEILLIYDSYYPIVGAEKVCRERLAIAL